MNLEFKKAEMENLDEVMKLFTSAIEEMDSQNIPQWDEYYPARDILQEDIEKNEMVIGLIGDKIAAVYVINKESDEQYGNGEWQYSDSEYRVVHRLCVNPEFQNRGVGSFVLKHLEDTLRDDKIETIRLDVFSLNPFSLRMYDKAGYLRVGETHWRKGKFYLMEKRL